MKRILAILLALSLLCGAQPVSMAEGLTVIEEEIEHEDSYEDEPEEAVAEIESFELGRQEDAEETLGGEDLA